MHFLGELFVGFFTIYLAFTNAIADRIEMLLPEGSITTQSTAATFQKISSAYESIPRILLENTQYQQANITAAFTKGSTAKQPIDALVNIFCTYVTDEYTRTVTGTGFFISSTGVILTNAHVAQFLLLETVEGSTDCIVRTGNPAVATYKADLLYISPAWIQKNAQLIAAQNPRGTGERDFALLYVTSGLNRRPMPAYFPAIALDTDLLSIRTLRSQVLAAGYPAETLFQQGDMNAALVPKQATTTIVELMTFGSNYADLMTIAGSNIGEQGSSGGPVVNLSGNVIGIISTKGDDTQFGKGSLRALTISYIDRTIKEETGFSLEQNMGGNLPYRSKIFKETIAPFLSRMLERALES